MRLHNRQIKAAFWTDAELIQNLPTEGRLFYLGLIQLADDSGCLEDNAFAFKIHLFPADNGATIEILTSYRDKLINMKKLIPYESNGKKCLFLKNFHKHQKLDRPSSPEIPLPSWIQWKEYPGKNPGKYIVYDNNSGEPVKDDKREGDFEEELAELISAGEVLIDGHTAVSVDRQVRIKGSYLDIVVSTEKGGYFFELKESFLSGAALAQVVKYQRYIKETGREGGEAILIGRGIIPSFSYDIAKQNNISVYVMKEDGTLNKLCGNVNIVISREITSNQCEKTLLAEPEPEPENEVEPEIKKSSWINAHAREDESEPDKSKTAVKHYEQNIGLISPSIFEQMNSFLEDGIQEDLVIKAIDVACSQNVRKWSYIKAILQNCLGESVYSKAQFEAKETEFQNQKKVKNNGGHSPPRKKVSAFDRLMQDMRGVGDGS